jgi:hypothetical protein
MELFSKSCDNPARPCFRILFWGEVWVQKCLLFFRNMLRAYTGVLILYISIFCDATEMYNKDMESNVGYDGAWYTFTVGLRQ